MRNILSNIFEGTLAKHTDNPPGFWLVDFFGIGVLFGLEEKQDTFFCRLLNSSEIKDYFFCLLFLQY